MLDSPRLRRALPFSYSILPHNGHSISVSCSQNYGNITHNKDRHNKIIIVWPETGRMEDGRLGNSAGTTEIIGKPRRTHETRRQRRYGLVIGGRHDVVGRGLSTICWLCPACMVASRGSKSPKIEARRGFIRAPGRRAGTRICGDWIMEMVQTGAVALPIVA
jgi:hypothetical protein